MKFYATSLAIAALLGSDVAAVKLTKDEKEQLNQTFKSTFDKQFDHYSKMATKDLFNMVQQRTKEQI